VLKSKLIYQDGSEDSILIKKINNNTALEKLVSDFNSTDLVEGDDSSKRVVIEILNMIKCKEFKLTNAGDSIFESFLNFKRNINVNCLSLYEEIKFDESILNNTVSYIMLGCTNDISCIPDFCKELNSLLSCASPTLYKSIIVNDNDFKEILDANNTFIEEGIDEENKKLDEIQSRNKSYYKVIIQSGISIIAKYGIGLSVLGSGSAVFIGGYVISHYLGIPRIEGGGKPKDDGTIWTAIRDLIRSYIKKEMIKLIISIISSFFLKRIYNFYSQKISNDKLLFKDLTMKIDQ
jgi:hypothetical protein